MADVCQSCTRSKRNVCEKIMTRSVVGSSARKDLGILRALLESKSRNFSKMWSKASKNPIGFDNQHLFFDKFRTVYTTNGSKRKPSLLYRLPQLHKKEKVEAAVAFETPLDQTSMEKCEKDKSYRPCMFAVTASGFLIRQDILSGELLQSVYLGKTYKFKHIFWGTDLHTLSITSIYKPHSLRVWGNIQNENINNNSQLVKYVAVFEVAPLRFLSVLPISKNIFGNDVGDASVSHSILFTMHGTDIVKLFSLEEILNNCTTKATLGTDFTSLRGDTLKGGVVGEVPFGLPVNTSFKQLPQMLLQVTSYHHFISFGGYPWHYLTSDGGREFDIFTLSNKRHVRNSHLNSIFGGIEDDHATFHPDNSGHVLHIGAHFVRYYKLNQISVDAQGPKCKFELKDCRSIGLGSRRSANSTVTHTSSGRKVINKECHAYYESLRDFDYEDELDILALLVSSGPYIGHIQLYDNCSGDLLKEFEISSWDDDGDHSLMMERDVIVHICRSMSRKCECNVFRLTNSVNYY